MPEHSAAGFVVSVEYYRQRGTVGRRGVTVGESAWSQDCGARTACSALFVLSLDTFVFFRLWRALRGFPFAA
jgi:hypothetical protein